MLIWVFTMLTASVYRSTLLDVIKQEVLFHMLCFIHGRNPSDRQAYISALCTEYEVILNSKFLNSKFLNSHTHADSASSSPPRETKKI